MTLALWDWKCWRTCQAWVQVSAQCRADRVVRWQYGVFPAAVAATAVPAAVAAISQVDQPPLPTPGNLFVRMTPAAVETLLPMPIGCWLQQLVRVNILSVSCQFRHCMLLTVVVVALFGCAHACSTVSKP